MTDPNSQSSKSVSKRLNPILKLKSSNVDEVSFAFFPLKSTIFLQGRYESPQVPEYRFVDEVGFFEKGNQNAQNHKRKLGNQGQKQRNFPLRLHFGLARRTLFLNFLIHFL